MAQRAAGLAFHTALSVIPILVIAVSIAGALGLLDGASDALVDAVLTAWIPVDDESIRGTLDRLIERAGSAYLGSIGLLFFLYTSISLFNEADQLFNDAWDVGRRRPIVKRIILFWTILTVAPPLITAGVVASSYIQVLVVTQLGVFRFTAVIVPALFPILLTFTALLFAMVLLPNTRVRWRPALVAALVTAVVFELGKFGFGFYVSQFASVSWFRIYGAIFLVPVLLLWIYVSWIIIALGVLMGACIQDFRESVLRQRASHRRFRESPGVMALLEVLLLLGIRIDRGEGSVSTTVLAEEGRLSRADTVRILKVLQRVEVVEPVMGIEQNERRWVLRQTLEHIELRGLLERCGTFHVEREIGCAVSDALEPLATAMRDAVGAVTLGEIVAVVRSGTESDAAEPAAEPLLPGDA